MSTASLEAKAAQAASSQRTSKKVYDPAILISVGIVVIGIAVATYALAVEAGASPSELGLMTAYP
jgi:hypothetical protein